MAMPGLCHASCLCSTVPSLQGCAVPCCAMPCHIKQAVQAQRCHPRSVVPCCAACSGSAVPSLQHCAMPCCAMLCQAGWPGSVVPYLTGLCHAMPCCAMPCRLLMFSGAIPAVLCTATLCHSVPSRLSRLGSAIPAGLCCAVPRHVGCPVSGGAVLAREVPHVSVSVPGPVLAGDEACV